MFRIAFPIKSAKPTEYYGMIVIDAKDVIHYWDKEGDYDGYSCDPHIDLETRTNMN